MHYSAVLAVFAAVAYAQNQTENVGSGTPNFNSAAACCTLDANSVDRDKRISWCRAQQNSCASLCGGTTTKNDCDFNMLTFDCQCFKANTPNVSDYAQTLPSLQCEEWVGKCVAAHPDDLSGQNLCHSIACGAKNASTSSGGSSSGGASGSSKPSGSSGSGSATSASGSSSTSTGGATTSSGAAAALKVAGQYGTGALAAGILAAFGLAL